MGNYILEIHKLLLESQDLPNPKDRLKLLNTAIGIADKHNDSVWGFETRLLLINTENFTPSSKLSYPAFVWILEKVDQSDSPFDEKEIMGEYKWLAATSYGIASLSKEVLEHITEDFKKRLVRNGFSLRSYHHLKALGLQQLRKFVEAREVIDLIKESPLDDLSDNMPFELSLEAYNYLGLEDYDAALIVAQDLFNNRFSYINTAFEAYCVFAFEFYRINDDRKDKYFELAKANLPEFNAHDCITYIRAKILYMYLLHQYGHESCWEHFEQVCIWEHEADDFYSFFFLKYAICLLKDGGIRSFNFPTYLPYYKEDGIYDLSEMLSIFKERTIGYAKQFDERNGNCNFVNETVRLFESN
ncbi:MULTISPECIES: hypothetical protein [Myroides]|uniref:Tetratricopeptide repeat protein n=1 Tax=Myroides albus TaxID=2562892 RepID=A0A6I3LL66_9FLAO|nr:MULTISPECIES: hypothetical protein [Myroides]MTG96912.1 hypothetical protein [Myroides albus]MVX35509.1 hypothetical protein [Myroides sp. LoEW2-1]UVD78338.1 hypothetical protein NWE55_09340 [Myroides albus]